MAKELKARKLDVLKFIHLREIVEIGDLVNQFGYTYKSAIGRLHRLEKAKLVEKLGTRPGVYCLTTEATRRLQYYDNKERDIRDNR